MPVDESLIGRTFSTTEPYAVTAERVAEFAAAVQTPWESGDPAPVTFPIVVSFGAMTELMNDPEVGISLHRVIHGEQRFSYERPIEVGDELQVELTVESIRSIGGSDIITTSSAVTDADGRLACTARATLVHSGEGSGS